ncbi:MAG: DUF4279 domain-containing protein [Rhodanobacter sp.]
MGCLRTYAGLCIYSPDASPDAITRILAVEPTRAVKRNLKSRKTGQRKHNFWLWSTEDLIDSTDHIDHLKEIFAVFGGLTEQLAELRNSGATTTISVYWDSNGQGGPTLDAITIAELNQLGVDIWWDVYFVPEDEDDGA